MRFATTPSKFYKLSAQTWKSNGCFFCGPSNWNTIISHKLKNNIYEVTKNIITQTHIIVRNIFVNIHLRSKGMRFNLRVFLQKIKMQVPRKWLSVKQMKKMTNQLKYNVNKQEWFMKMWVKNCETNRYIWLARIDHVKYVYTSPMIMTKLEK